MTHQPLEVIDWRIERVTERERKAIHAGMRGAQCKWHELRDTAAKAANYADNIGAKSWDIVPLIQFGKEDPKVGFKFYNRVGHGMCGFGNLEHITGHVHGKNDFWFDNLPQPHWLDINKGVKDRSAGINWHPEYE